MNHRCMYYFPYGHRVTGENPELRLVRTLSCHWSKRLLCRHCHGTLMAFYEEKNKELQRDAFIISRWEDCQIYE